MSVVGSGSIGILFNFCILWLFMNPSLGFVLKHVEFQSRAKIQLCHRDRTTNPRYIVKRRQPRSRSALRFMSLPSDSDDVNLGDDNHEQTLESPASMSDMTIPADTRSTNKLEPLSLTLLWAQLDIRNISYDPSATRSELEALLARSTQDRSFDEVESELSLQSLLAQLDAKNIRYPPSASRRE